MKSFVLSCWCEVLNVYWRKTGDLIVLPLPFPAFFLYVLISLPTKKREWQIQPLQTKTV
jgi:hypothetical protein